MAKMITFITGENKMGKIAAYFANVKENYVKAMDSYGNAIIKVKTK
ncbi:hypothetical protein [uncultured Metabacillus sp.]|nr:hypothetical protein [uncultured Metabacillus sp.]